MVKIKILKKINSPKDLNGLEISELEILAGELRSEIIKTVSNNGGHLGSNLGICELAISLHYVFDAPQDKFIWDVGHQAYPHKVLTGRKDKFNTIRQHKGISGFPKRCESEFDVFGTGHTATSISAALGIAIARDFADENYKVIAVIGDGALTGGIVFEALNQAGYLKNDLLLVLNDNAMSISPNVGALSSTRDEFDDLSPSKNYSSFFESLGFSYFGPFDGHNLESLISNLKNIKDKPGPCVVHALTKKGKGYNLAESDKQNFHGRSPFNICTGELKSRSKQKKYTNYFSDYLIDLAKEDNRIVAITAGMPNGTGLDKFDSLFPSRFFDVGICEQHAITFAAGLATQGLRPVVAIYSTFMQRGYDQLIHDVCLQNLPVVFALDRGGLVGEDGPTHHGVFDLSFLRAIPNLAIMSPKDEFELGAMLEFATNHNAPIAIRFPRGLGEGKDISDSNSYNLQLAKSELLRKGSDLAIFAVGDYSIRTLEIANELSESLDCEVINARFVKPLDQDLLLGSARKCGRVLTIEENALAGGFGSAVLELLSDDGLYLPVERLGIPDKFIEHGHIDILRANLGLSKAHLKLKIMSFYESTKNYKAKSEIYKSIKIELD